MNNNIYRSLLEAQSEQQSQETFWPFFVPLSTQNSEIDISALLPTKLMHKSNCKMYFVSAIFFILYKR